MLSGTENSTMFPFLGTDPGEIIAQIIDYFHPRGRGKQHTLMSCFRLSGGIIAPDCITGMDNNTTLASLLPTYPRQGDGHHPCYFWPWCYCGWLWHKTSILQKRSPGLSSSFLRPIGARWRRHDKFTSSFLTTYLDNTVENYWSSFKEHITMLMSTHILSKTTSQRQNLPWFFWWTASKVPAKAQNVQEGQMQQWSRCMVEL